MTKLTPRGQVPDALRLAEEITNLECSSEAVAKTIAAAADELCRLHVENASLRASPAASPTPPAEQQVIIDFAQVGTAGPFHVVNGRVKLPDATMQDLARMLRPTYEAGQAAPKVDGFYEAVNDMDGLYQAAPKAAPGDVLDEALRERDDAEDFIEALRERDDAEDFIDALLDEVLGHERSEWSNLYGRADALNDVQERMTALSDDTKRLNWLLWKLPGGALRYVVGELSDTSSGAEFRAAIDAALAAQGGKA